MAKENSVSIAQAFFGQKDRGHGLLMTTVEDTEINTFLTRVSDMPVNKPGGLTLAPFMGCHRIKNMLAFSKTFPDKEANRPGMVFTQSLIILEDEAKEIGNLDKVFEHFFKEIPEKASLRCEELSIVVGSSDLNSPVGHIDMLKRVVDKLIEGVQIIALELTEDIQDLIVSMWNNSVPLVRQYLTFRLSFSASDIDANDHKLYFVPGSLLVKWDQEMRIDSSAPFNPKFPLSVELLVNARVETDFKAFISELGKLPAKIEDFSLYERAYNYYQNLQHLTPVKLLQLIRLVGKIAPEQRKGTEVKARVFAVLGSHLRNKQDEDLLILSFSNIESSPLEFIPDIMVSIEKRILEWWNEKDDRLILGLVERRISEGNISWWNIMVDRALGKIFQAVEQPNAFRIWEIWGKERRTINYIFKLLTGGVNTEKHLIKGLPKSLGPVVKILLPMVKQNGWGLLYANLLLLSIPANNAMKLQIDFTPENKDALKIIADKMDKIVLLDFAMDKENPILIEICSEVEFHWDLVSEKIKYQKAGWQKFLLAKFTQMPIGQKRQQVFEQVVFGILDHLYSGGNVLPKLLDRISSEPLNNLLSYKKRKKIWKKLPLDLKNRFLKATAIALLDSSWNTADVEQELKEAVRTFGLIGGYMQKYKDDWNRIIDVFELVPNLSEQFLRDHLYYTSWPIDNGNANRLGNMIMERRWASCANIIFDKSKHVRGFDIVSGKCSDLLSVWKRIETGFFFSNFFTPMASNSLLSEHEWLNAAEELLVEIYKDDLDIRAMWVKAGGDISDLISRESARNIWAHAIQSIKNGRARNMSFKKLLSQAKKENESKKSAFEVLLAELTKLPNIR